MTTWTVAEITFEAHWQGHKPDTLVMPCRVISYIPAEEKQTSGADSVMPNLGPAYLLVEGVSLKAFSMITWKPNQLLFNDAKTGEQLKFPVRLVDILQPDTVKFVVQN